MVVLIKTSRSCQFIKGFYKRAHRLEAEAIDEPWALHYASELLGVHDVDDWLDTTPQLFFSKGVGPERKQSCQQLRAS